MVKRFHEAGIEVILDVVYNHTAEGNQNGPTLSFRGIDNASYYLLSPEDPRFCFDTTGTGNTVNMRHPRVMQMVMDSLRYWVEDCHVDGFRFDLASTLGRDFDDFDPNAAFLDACAQDPTLQTVKMIAEPWDVGVNGYQLGNFPPGWAEWNGRYRDDIRSYWKGDGSSQAGLASGLLASANLFDKRGRRAWSSVNFVTAHDGFTLMDLWSYNEKHNEANGREQPGRPQRQPLLELRRRGRNRRRARALAARPPAPLDHGLADLLPGHAHDPDGRRMGPLAPRQQQRLRAGQRAQLARLATRRGGASPKREIDPDGPQPVDESAGMSDDTAVEFADFVAKLVTIRETPRAPGAPTSSSTVRTCPEPDVPDVMWFGPDGAGIPPEAWHDEDGRIALMLNGAAERSLLMFLNPNDEIAFTVPPVGEAPDLPGEWRVLVDCANGEIDPLGIEDRPVFRTGDEIRLGRPHPDAAGGARRAPPWRTADEHHRHPPDWTSPRPRISRKHWGAEPQGDGTWSVPPVGARRRFARADARRRDARDGSRRRRLVRRHPRGPCRLGLRLRPAGYGRARGAHRARPGGARAVGRRPRALAPRRPRRLRLDGRLVGPAVGGDGALRGPCRHLDAGRHVRRHAREARPSGRRSA